MDVCPRCNAPLPQTANFCNICGLKLAFFQNLKPGTSIGNYILVRRLGIGGIGAVYLARHKLLNQLVAIKVHDFFPEDEDVGRDFRRASNYLSQLDHPHIVHLYDYGFQSGRAYQAMEYIDGSMLNDLIPDQQTRSWIDRCLQYFTQLFSAIRYAHNCQYYDMDGTFKRTIIHGDIKPRNIFISRSSDTVKLTDFMIPDVQAFLGKSFHWPEHATEAFGTPGYMSPEQARPGKGRVSQQTDIYSLGITMYVLVTGYLPGFFEIAQGLNPRKINPHVPHWLDSMIAKATQIEPADRFQSVAEMESILLANQNQERTYMNINVGNISNVSGQLFIGQFNTVVANLNGHNQTQLVEVLKALKEAVMASQFLSIDKKQEQVDIINQIGQEAAKPDRNKTLLKMLIDGLMTASKVIPDVANVMVKVAFPLTKLYN